MKYLLLFIMSFTTLANSDHFCQVKKGGTTHYKTPSSHYIFKGINLYRIENETTRLIPTKYPIKAVREFEDKLYILTGEYIFVRSLNDFTHQFEIKTTKVDLIKKHQEAQDMEFLNGALYVAHGSQGVVKIDPRSGEILSHRKFDLPHEPSQISTATGISSINDKLYVMMDNVTYNFSTKKRAFEGLVITNDELMAERIIPIRQSREALHYPKSFATKKFLISRNLQNLYYYEMKKMNSARTLWPKRRVFNLGGLQLSSNPALINGEISGCFSKYKDDKFTYHYRTFKM